MSQGRGRRPEHHDDGDQEGPPHRSYVTVGPSFATQRTHTFDLRASFFGLQA
jgi:hypothetical protein